MRNWFYFCFLLLANTSFAQRSELGFLAGACNYWGDLAPSVKAKETHATLGVFGRVNFNHTWAMRLELNRFTISGHDANFDFNKVRNLSFETNLNEAALIFEFNYLKYGPFVLHENFTSYVYAGVSAFTFNPRAYLNGVWYDLSDYRTENKAYSKFSMAIPFGIGVKYMMNKRFAIESQLGFRKTYTDYLDDVSTVYGDINEKFNDGGLISATLTDRSIEKFGAPQFKNGYKRGDPSHKDWYMSLTVGVSMRLNTKVKCARFF